MTVFGATDAVCEFVSGFRPASVPDEVWARASDLVADTLFVAVAATGSDVWDTLGPLVDPALGPAGSTVVGRGLTRSAGLACWANGALAHALEYDDSTLSPIGHPSCVIVPAVVALAEQLGASGAAVLEAYVVGLEVHSRLGQAEAGGWKAEGAWLPIGHVSVLGAAAGCSRLLGLDPVRTGHALGLAAQSCGTLSVAGGSMAKPLAAGSSARAGLEAALLARSGATGPEAVIERPGGFADVYLGPGHDLAGPLGRLGAPHHLEEVGVAVKRYPSVYATHWGMDALLAIMSDQGLAAGDVESVDLVHPAAAAFCDNPTPHDVEEARFSHEYNLAVALLDGVPGPPSYSGDRLGAADLRDALRRVRARSHPPGTEPPLSREYLVTVTGRDGRRWTASVARPLGHPRNPMGAGELEAKFRRCVAGRLSENEATSLRAEVHNLAGLANLSSISAVLARARTSPE